ncbi:helicase-exonuclease AddAB subunit AddB [Clostridium grantii]|uniref:ATP-dependent helicase/deoxyribonuclease subunit B n=1 Tax=Clostridium grantii DSM 8605 TaxID=1121316 RepID=A0A1M5WTI8_9CLOT|nr:helicase-exonuclease AddAB subunit AddB [Clostridium grantii]SHH90742.1 DNA helicase/exodeoxyribonuclease V, subunit B [Clostridium grantii DSM 8605]
MGLRFVFGRAGFGKSSFAMNSIKENLHKDKQLYLLVPDQFSYTAEKTMVKEIGGTGIINADVLTFKRIARKVFSEVGGNSKDRIMNSGKNMLIYSIMNDIKDDLSVFQLAAKQKGFVDSVATMISEFKNYNISALELQTSLVNFDEGDLLKEKLKDVASIYKSFEEKLKDNFIDDDDELTILNRKIDESSMFDGEEIWIDEFNSFTPQQYLIVEKIIKKAARVNVCLIGDYYKDINNESLFNVTTSTYDKLIEIAMENNIGIDKPIVLKGYKGRFSNNMEIKFLEENYFKYPCDSYKEDNKNISILKANNPYEEVEETAKKIISLCRDEGYRYKDIVVVSRNLDTYEKIVKAIFDSYDIPPFIDKKKDVDDNPLIILITSIIDIFNKNWSYESVFRYLKSGLIKIDIDEIDALENYVLAAGIRGKKRWSESWDYNINYNFQNNNLTEEDEIMLKEINEIREKIARPLIDLHENIKGSHKASELCSSMFNFLCDLGINETIETWVQDFRKKGNEELAVQYSEIWNMVMEIFDEIVNVFKEEKIILKDFVNILSIGFQKKKMGLIPPTLDVVTVGSIDRIRSHSIKALFVLGVNDGVFPAVMKEDGVFNDGDREKLRNFDINLSEDSKAKTFGEQFLVYTTLTLPLNYLNLSYSMADFEGKTLRASVIINRLKKIFPKLKENSIIDDINKGQEDFIKDITMPKPTFNNLVKHVSSKNKKALNNPVWEEVHKWYCSHNNWKDKCDIILNAEAYTNQVKLIKEEKVKKLYGNKLNLSVSRLEKYVECPFAYFAQYGLGAKERKIFKLTPPDLGSFMHGVIDDFSKLVKDSDKQWSEIDDEWCKEKVDLIFQRKITEISSSIFNSSARYRYFSERLRRVLIKTILVIIEHMRRSGFQPVGYEVIFGENGDYPSIEVDLEDGEKVYLSGRIDRVDKLTLDEKEYYRIIDYKSGNKDFDLNSVYYGLQIQLMLYLDAILTNENSSHNEESKAAGVFYFRIEDPIIKGSKEMSPEKIQQAILKELKMKGLILEDVKIVTEMDKEIEGHSLIIPASVKKDGNLGKSSSLASDEDFNSLRNFVRKGLASTCERMLKGEIKIEPYKNQDMAACKYCLYSSVCKFDSTLEDNNYKVLKKRDNDEVWSLIKEGSEE